MSLSQTDLISSQSIILIGQVAPAFLQRKLEVSPQDLFVLDDDYSIAHLKDLLHFVFLKPYNSKKKLAIVCNVENLGSEAANALLKTLEEPPPYAHIILTTLNEQKILPTILSRCSKIRLEFTADLQPPPHYQSPDVLAKKTVAERFRWAAEVAEAGEATQIIVLWQHFYREKLLLGEDVLAILKQLSVARDLLQTNISVKLLLENLILEF